ncbi:MAG: hypothetical protein JKY27_13065 [Magnetovibrio sp.]|nr:hypothetical protein [Magnetovibrio sp.]
MDSTFCDGVMDISITGGVVRVDFFDYVNGENDSNGNPPRQHNHRILLTPEAFLQTYTAFDQVINQLVEKGLLTRRDEAAQ